ncbi:carbonic anhydrase 2-like [Athalia rosae]|uniref:carbonic anhydrase 2-like n=1 Tax=Athalia rosae TaxID=37344 RepID=UPI002034386A|nr:carbonic anhydrase 2-like [Athalia rosae]XP_012253824.2 carbonic anhydrase 2-like [Athalia rosae]
MHYLILTAALFAILQFVNGNFGYSPRHQHTWAKEHKHCSGEWQSPIALSSARAVPLPLPALEMISFHNLLSGPINVTNNGHSVALSIPKAHLEERLPHVFGALLNKGQNYEFEGLHFHWGMKNNRGSEHILNGVRYPMEMHIILRNVKYPKYDEAVQYKDGLTVLGIFFQLQEEDNEKFDPILRTLPNVQWVNSVVRMNASFTLASVIPEDTDIFYTYKGSLTTPPCNEAVVWIIFPTPVQISFRQMSKFRMLSNGEDVLADNYRRLQDIRNRKVYVRRLDSRHMNYEDAINLDIEQLEWIWR